MTRAVDARRLAAAVLLPGFAGTEVPGWLEREVEGGLAGVVYFGPNVRNAAQVTELSAALHGLRGDLLIGADEEGGDVTRLEVHDGSSYPGNAALGYLDDMDATTAVGRSIGRDLRLAGIDLNLAPTVDVNADPDNPVIGTRSFGAEPDLVARHSGAYVRGLQSAGVAACAKHFPGHGDTTVDSHLDLPVVDADLATLRGRDLPPFAAAIEAGVRCVLTAHIRFPALDERPATLSPVVLGGLLRDELGFDGAIVTDALDMHAIASGVGTGHGAVLALAAGADLLCIGNPRDDVSEYEVVLRALVDAVTDGTLALRRLEEAGDRARALAGWVRDARALPVPDVPAGAELGLGIARRVVRAMGDVRLGAAPHVIDVRTHANEAAGRHAPWVRDEVARRLPGSTSASLAPAAQNVRAAVAGALAEAGTRPVLVVAHDPHRDSAQASVLEAITAARPDAIVVSTGWPDERRAFGGNGVVTYGSGRVNARAAVELLLGGPEGTTAAAARAVAAQ